MLKALKIILAIVVIAAAAIFAYAATLPNSFRVARTVTIKAPAERIYPLVNSMKGFNTWNPFLKAEPSSKITYSGPESGKGAGYAWDGAKSGKGRMEIVETTAPSHVKCALTFTSPMTANNTVDFSLRPQGDGTEVTWAMSGPWPLLHRAMSVVFNMDKMVGGEFEKGLRDLKGVVEGR